MSFPSMVDTKLVKSLFRQMAREGLPVGLFNGRHWFQIFQLWRSSGWNSKVNQFDFIIHLLNGLR